MHTYTHTPTHTVSPTNEYIHNNCQLGKYLKFILFNGIQILIK